MSERKSYVWIIPHDPNCEHQYISRADLAEKMGVSIAEVMSKDYVYEPIQVGDEMLYCWPYVDWIIDAYRTAAIWEWGKELKGGNCIAVTFKVDE